MRLVKFKGKIMLLSCYKNNKECIKHYMTLNHLYLIPYWIIRILVYKIFRIRFNLEYNTKYSLWMPLIKKKNK